MSVSSRDWITTARALANAVDHEVRERYAHWDAPLPGVGRSVNRVSEARFERVFAEHAEDVVFVHAGLGAVSRAFDRDPYAFLRDTLDDAFESVLVPGFTPSFRRSGIYHKLFSTPEYGAFARQFLADADRRTDDPIHSILVRGSYRFDDCDQRDTFGPDGCWARLDDENVLYCNVGTPWIVSTQHHFIEHDADVPYNHPQDHEGVIYYDEERFEKIEQRNYMYDIPARRNARGIERRLRNEGAIEVYDLDGLEIRFFRARRLRECLARAIERDPCFLVA